MQNTNEQRDGRSFEQYVAEMRGFLTQTFGVKAGSSEIAMARQCHANYCAAIVPDANLLGPATLTGPNSGKAHALILQNETP